jgi:hypothetical protein
VHGRKHVGSEFAALIEDIVHHPWRSCLRDGVTNESEKLRIAVELHGRRAVVDEL